MPLLLILDKKCFLFVELYSNVPSGITAFTKTTAVALEVICPDPIAKDALMQIHGRNCCISH